MKDAKVKGKCLEDPSIKFIHCQTQIIFYFEYKKKKIDLSSADLRLTIQFCLPIFE